MKRIIKRNNILYSNTMEFESYLSEMAAKGYFLKKIIFVDYLEFYKDEPQTVRYFIDYYNPEGCDEMEKYCKLHKSRGLKKIESKNNMHIFIETSNNAKLEIENNKLNLLLKREFINKVFIPMRILLYILLFVFLDMVILDIRYNIVYPNVIVFIRMVFGSYVLLALIKYIDYKSNIMVIEGKRCARKILITNAETVIISILLFVVFFMGLFFFD